MKAMILAAGVGSRLDPLTQKRPKALIEVAGVPMLEIVAKRLIEAGVKEMVVNVHHLADKIVDFLKARRSFGILIEISRETELLDTGGGLKKVADFFKGEEPFFLHNVDVFSDMDLRKMYQFHCQAQALATLAVQSRKSGRYFLFDRQGFLRGWESVAENRKQLAGVPQKDVERLAFGGIHVISPQIFSMMSEKGVFSINQTYLRLAAEGRKIQAFRCDERYCQDIGSPEKLEAVRGAVKGGFLRSGSGG